MIKSLKSQRKLGKKVTKKNEATIELLELDFMSIPRKPRTKTIIRKIMKKDLKFNSSTGSDQMGDHWYSISLSEYEIPGSISDDLDALTWDINQIIFHFWDNIPE
ncbi:hypothetical protein EJD97_002417 [Solanum chilense]|uniref:Uncharacterized protein n=1 Tax=Solanum chilense TaxID=4083 RepID=A0A6N2ANM8_SOLCI|nr:hypothetical protein EJD97_002417 [Solanum chilense]